MSKEFQQHYLRLALFEAEKKRGFCAPNPSVGAVVLKEGRIVGIGHHQGVGHPHAEVIALRQAGKHSRGSTLYVTLEPCCHFGRTPPCTELILETGVEKIYYGYRDPNPKVAGKGQIFLQEHGITCNKIDNSQVDLFYRSYEHWWRTKRPYVTGKLALSRDGKIAGAHGAPVHFTGKLCQLYTHECRNVSDALLTTVNTIIHDDPQLNVRLANTIIPKPIYVLDSNLQTPLNAQIFKTARHITFFHRPDIDKNKIEQFCSAGARCVSVNRDQNGLDLENLLDVIGEDGVHDLWIEGGGRCFQSFFAQGLMNCAIFYCSSKYLGENALNAFSHESIWVKNNYQIEWFALGQDMACKLSS